MAVQTQPEEEKVLEDSGEDIERLVFFSDAVFAIAMTLLIIDIHVPEVDVPEALWNGLLQLWPNILGFIISFFVISTYWRIHHRMFHIIKRYDRRLISLNFVLLFLIVIIPFTTALISQYGDWQLPVVIYDSCLVLAGFVIAAIWVHATSGGRLVDADLDQRVVRHFTFRSLYMSLTFLLIIGLTFLIPSALAQLALLVLAPAQHLPFLRRVGRGREAAPRSERNTGA